MPTKVKEAIAYVEGQGWYHVGTAGSHRHYRHPTRPGKVTIAGKRSADIPAGTWASIRRQAEGKSR